jgi:hypothetical protein
MRGKLTLAGRFVIQLPFGIGAGGFAKVSGFVLSNPESEKVPGFVPRLRDANPESKKSTPHSGLGGSKQKHLKVI